MEKTLTESDCRLLAIYAQQGYQAYVKGDMRETLAAVARIEQINPGDVHARFLYGAMTGRKAKPGSDMQVIRQTIALWKPLYEQLEGSALEAMKAAMAEALTTILYIPVELATRAWDVYHDQASAQRLAGTIRTLLVLDDDYAAQQTDYSQWLHTQFTTNYVFLVDEVIGINKPYPVGASAANVRAYGDALKEVIRMAERISSAGDSQNAVRERAFQRMRDYSRHNIP